MEPLDCVAFMLVRDGHVLAEKRGATKRLAPGAVALPGGHVEGDEGLEAALRREMLEELGIAALGTTYVCTLLHRAEELRRLHYYAVTSWEGEPRPLEAEALTWIPFDATQRLEIDVDRIAVNEYLRVTRDGRQESTR
ncbi:MAG: NUDIX domain-containing protein [Candidatus Rokubacteria bacterium]|nr:NUDIX domain-containing protein [Candidatus Rokubacteria bacterium]MBI3826851.1 NUDIX domain-containing protein [Candidatus Rokubacteria bacterium]